MKIQVKQCHIDKGKRKQAGSCPIALAAKEAHPGAVDVAVLSWLYVRIPGEHLSRSGELPSTAREFVRAFDKGDPVAPFEFDIELS